MKLKQKTSKGLGILCKARKLLTKYILLQLYYSFIYPYLAYGIVVWCSTCQYTLDSHFKLQNRAIRLVTMSTYNAHTGNLFRCTNILQVQKVYVFNAMIFMFKFHVCQLPGIFSHLFQPIPVVHSHFTRHSCRLHVAISKSNVSTKAIRSRSVFLWNSRSNHLIVSKSLLFFSKKVLRVT